MPMTTLPRRLLAAHAAVAAVGLCSMIAAAVVLARVGAVQTDQWLATAIWSLLALSGASLLFLMFAVHRVSSEMTEQLSQVAAIAKDGRAAELAGGARPAVVEFDELGSAVLRASARREAAEADLAGERRRLEAMVRTLPIGLLIADPAGRIALCNEAAVARVAQLEDGARCAPGETIAAALLAPVDDAATRGAPREIRTNDGAILEIGEHALDQSGDRLWVLRDVTAERTLGQRRMQFLLRTAHELRTPLASLSMAINLLRAHCDGEPAGPRDARGVGRAAQESVERLAHLSERLLRWGALTQQAKASEPRFISWDRLAAAVTARGQAWSQRYSKPVSISADAEGGEVATVPEHLLALLDELLDNAFRAARTAGGVEIGLHQRDEIIELSVRDHGPGIHPAVRASWQAPLTIAGPRPGDGAGLGLAIASELARVIGADLQLASLRDGSDGTRFDIRIPHAPTGLAASSAERKTAALPDARNPHDVAPSSAQQRAEIGSTDWHDT